MRRSAAAVVREYGPFEDAGHVHGLTYDGRHVWFASGDKLNALDPVSGRIVRSFAAAAHAGTAFVGRHLYQIAEDRIQKIDPQTAGVAVSGLESDGGDLFYCGGATSGKVRAVRRPKRERDQPSPSASSAALPPAAAVLTDNVRSTAKRGR